MLFYILHMQMALHFFNDELSVIEMMKVFDKFSPFSGLIPNKSRCQVAGMGVLKGKKMESINLRLDSRKNVKNAFFLQ